MKKRGFWVSDKKKKNREFFNRNFFPKNRRGISVMIGYVLLISMMIMMSVIVYQWVKTYVPTDSLECGDGVSLFVKSYIHDCTANTLKLTLKNNGRFDVMGYFIHATTEKDKELATTDLSSYGGEDDGFVPTIIKPNLENEKTFSFGTMTTDTPPKCDVVDLDPRCIYSLDITPIKNEIINDRSRAVACSDARIKQPLQCGAYGISCLHNNIIQGGEECDC